jgi:glycosyltransferase involved in cell wall biosynthesis
MQVHQFHPTVSYGDATSNQICDVQGMLRRLGYRSEIFCERLPAHFRGRVRRMERYAHYASPESILLLHFSLGYSSRVMDWLQDVPGYKVIVYHNITPHTYFAGINDVYEQTAKRGRAQLSQLNALSDVGWGDSDYNCQELTARGWTRLGVLPIAFDPGRYAVRPDRKVLKRWQSGLNVLFVGRVSPNKRFEDLILTFYYLKRHVRSDARLLMVGSAQGMRTYLEFLQALVTRLGLSDVVFTGHVSTSQLVAYYRCATVYLSMSEHEGFGVPFLESMHFGVPVIAYKAAAVPETLGSCGVLVTDKDYARVAELIAVLAEDEDLRAQIVSRQCERLQAFLPDRIEAQLGRLLRELAV